MFDVQADVGNIAQFALDRLWWRRPADATVRASSCRRGLVPGGARTVLQSTISQGFAEIHGDGNLIVSWTELGSVVDGFDFETHGDGLSAERDVRVKDPSSHAAGAPKPRDQSLELLGFAGDLAIVENPCRWIAVIGRGARCEQWDATEGSHQSASSAVDVATLKSEVHEHQS